MSGIGKRALVTSTVISALVGSGLAFAPSADAAVTASMSYNAYKFAYSQKGKPYVLGAVGLKSYDCSGLVWRSYSEAGKSWTRHTADYMRKYQTVDITTSQRRVGDLIFFEKNGDGDSIYDHVGIYAGHGYMVDAQTGTYYGHGVVKEPVDNSWWSKNYTVDYRRVK